MAHFLQNRCHRPEWFKTPSGALCRVIHLLGADNNNYKVIEVSEWFDLAVDIWLSLGQYSGPQKLKSFQEFAINFV